MFGRILNVDLSTGAVAWEQIPAEWVRDFIGGSGLAARLLWEDLDPARDPFDPRSPLLFITGDQAHSREFSEDAYRLAAEPKELHVVPGAGHVDLYDRVGLIPWDALTAFFRKNLARPA